MRQAMHSIWVILAIGLLFLSGCAGQYLEVSEKAIERIPQDIGRFSAHLGVRKEEEKTKQKVAEAKKAEADAEKAASENRTVVIDTIEKYAIHALREANKTLGEVAKALARRDGGNEFGLSTTPTPKGVIAETLDSAGNAIAKVADTPAALAGVVGTAAVKISKAAIKEAGDTVLAGDDSPVTITKTTTNTTQKSTNTAQEGSATGSVSQPEQPALVEEEITEEAVAEVPVEPVTP